MEHSMDVEAGPIVFIGTVENRQPAREEAGQASSKVTRVSLLLLLFLRRTLKQLPLIQQHMGTSTWHA